MIWFDFTGSIVSFYSLSILTQVIVAFSDVIVCFRTNRANSCCLFKNMLTPLQIVQSQICAALLWPAHLNGFYFFAVCSLRIHNSSKSLSSEIIDEEYIISAISEAEKGNRGEIRVHIEKKCPREKVFDRAKELFELFEMHQTREGTGMILYIAIEDRLAAIFAGHGIHGEEEPDFWQKVVNTVANESKRGSITSGIVMALGIIGEFLRRVVPGDDDSGNELPNEVTIS